MGSYWSAELKRGIVLFIQDLVLKKYILLQYEPFEVMTIYIYHNNWTTEYKMCPMLDCLVLQFISKCFLFYGTYKCKKLINLVSNLE